MLWPESVQWWYFPCFLCSWDESSSISSGLSDGSDNLSSEEFNAGSSLNSLPTTPIGSRRNSAIVVIHFNLIEILLSLSVFLLQGLLHQLANLWHTILDRSSLSTQCLLLMGWMCYKPLTALEWESAHWLSRYSSEIYHHRTQTTRFIPPKDSDVTLPWPRSLQGVSGFILKDELPCSVTGSVLCVWMCVCVG